MKAPRKFEIKEQEYDALVMGYLELKKKVLSLEDKYEKINKIINKDLNDKN